MRANKAPIAWPESSTSFSSNGSSHRVGLWIGASLMGALVAGATWVLAHHQIRKTALVHRTLIDVLLNALSRGDQITFRHSRRVAALTDVLAAELCLPRSEQATLRVASLLHDMGKIDDRYFHIVHSRGKLSDEERAEIKHHPHSSATILEPLERFHPRITEIVSSHHECWDGGGYPEGKAGEEIPLSARIIAVADVFDALTQPRAYHEPKTIDEVFDLILENAGKQFDPRVTSVLRRPHVRQQWVEIAEEGKRVEEAAIAAAREAEALTNRETV